MQTTFPACNLPRCSGRWANTWLRGIALALACVTLWPATANSQPSANDFVSRDSEFQLASPAGRLQQRHASELRNLGVTPALDWEPIVHMAARWCTELTSLQGSLEEQHHLAMLQDAVGPGADNNQEQIEAGQVQRDPCFVAVPISSVRVGIAAPAGKLPEDIAAQCRRTSMPVGDTRLTCGWAVYEKHWAATCMHHRPLYFEEVNAERYGYTRGHCVQPFISAGRFLATIPALPYLMVARPPCECIYTLGHYRPGDCVPYRWHHPPRHVAAGVFEAAVIVGLVALVP